jgi:hypothetical protein
MSAKPSAMLSPQRVHVLNAICLIVLGLIGSPISNHIPEAIGVLLLAMSPMLKAGQKIVIGMSLFLEGVVALVLAFSLYQGKMHLWDNLRMLLMLSTVIWSAYATWWVRVRMG